MTSKKIYVAGKNGLVGSNLIKELGYQGYYVISTDSRTLDLRNFQAVKDYFDRNKPDYVVLVAAKHGGIEEYGNNPVEYLEDNVLISGNVIKCAYEHDVKRLINIGASCVYRVGKDGLLKESEYDKSPVQKPTEPYGLAKLYGMKLCEYYNRQKGTQFISLLPVNLYGDGVGYRLDYSNVLPSMMKKFHTAKVNGYSCVEIWGDGKTHREFLHVRDLVKAIETLLGERELAYDMYNAGSGEAISINGLARLMAEVTGYGGKIVNNLDKPNGADRGILDTSRLRALGWEPSVSLHDGVRELYERLLENGTL